MQQRSLPPAVAELVLVRSGTSDDPIHSFRPSEGYAANPCLAPSNPGISARRDSHHFDSGVDIGRSEATAISPRRG
jgi:hypothetical protein